MKNTDTKRSLRRNHAAPAAYSLLAVAILVASGCQLDGEPVDGDGDGDLDGDVASVTQGLNNDPSNNWEDELTQEDMLEVQYTGQDLLPVDDGATPTTSTTAGTSTTTSTNIVVRGRLVCSDSGAVLPHATLTARDRNVLSDVTLATGATDAYGNFQLVIPATLGDQAPDRPDVYVDIRFSDDGRRLAENNGPRRISITDDLGRVRGLQTLTYDNTSRGAVLDLATVNIAGKDCALFASLDHVYEHFYTQTCQSPGGCRHHPSGSVRIHRWSGWVTGTPWSALSTINWPNNSYYVNELSVRHEFGHTLRHTLDGSAAHFAGDVLAYTYAQNHTGCDTHNEGFAFNEGWADYWEYVAGPYAPATCSGGLDFHRENDVARKLLELDDCSGGPMSMYEVLRLHPGTIHSYSQFYSAWLAAYPQCAPPPPPPTDPCAGLTGDEYTCCVDPDAPVCGPAFDPCVKKPWLCEY